MAPNNVIIAQLGLALFFPYYQVWSSVTTFTLQISFFWAHNFGCALSTWDFMGVMPLVLLYFIKPLLKTNHFVKSISNVYSNLQMMHHNIYGFSKSTWWLSLIAKNHQHIKIWLWSLQAIAYAFMVSSWKASKFGTLLPY